MPAKNDKNTGYPLDWWEDPELRMTWKQLAYLILCVIFSVAVEIYLLASLWRLF